MLSSLDEAVVRLQRAADFIGVTVTFLALEQYLRKTDQFELVKNQYGQ